MSDVKTDECIEIGGVIITSAFVAPALAHRLYERVPVDRIESAALKRGFVSTHPLLQTLAGVALLALAAAAITAQIRWYFEDGTVSLAFLWGTPFPLLVGGWTIFDALRRGAYIAVDGRCGPRKFPLDRNADEQRCGEQLRAICAARGWLCE